MKKTYLISYDMAEGGNYDELFKAIKDYGTWAHITESLWAVKTEQSATEIRENLGQFFPKGSRIFIIKSGVEAAWRNVICRNEWLKDNL
ncbi:MAG: hypothetical protein M0R16_05540 [Bacteroidales bacterium]|jgi:hypothetical protein|nr:hypothetical protein [Bacteroidales bacterium]